VKTGQNVGYLWFASNFSDSIFLFKDDPELDYHDNGFVRVYLDRTELQKTSFIERKLFEAFESFVENVMVDCNRSSKAGKLVVASEALIGSMNFEFKQTMAPGFIIT
jgi:phosphomevalonate kinase